MKQLVWLHTFLGAKDAALKKSATTTALGQAGCNELGRLSRQLKECALMQPGIKKLSIPLLVLVAIFAIGVSVISLQEVPRLRTASTPSALNVSGAPKVEQERCLTSGRNFGDKESSYVATAPGTCSLAN